MVITKELVLKYPWVLKSLQKIESKRTKDLVNDISPFLRSSQKVIDIGSGLGSVSKVVKMMGKSVVPIDVCDVSIHDDCKPIIYDGKTIPFENCEFDSALLLTVLHHISDPVVVLKEASRVAKRVIIIEEIFHNTWEKYLTHAMDSIVNLEFEGHPHSNKSHSEWKAVFEELSLTLEYVSHRRYWGMFWSTMYVLENRLEG